MPKSAAKLATSCFAFFACLLCFSAAPVVGQEAVQNKPAASTPVSPPSPVPTVFPTPASIALPAPPASRHENAGLTNSVNDNKTATVSPLSPWAAVFAAFVGGVFGGVLSPILTYKLGERNRRLDLFKIYYPMKVKAVNDVSQALSDSFYIVGKYQFNMISLDECRNNVVALRSLIRSCSYFVEPETRECMKKCGNLLFDCFANKKLDVDAYNTAIDELNATYPQTLHLEVFADLFPPKKQAWLSTILSNKKAVQPKSGAPSTGTSGKNVSVDGSKKG